MIDPTRIKDLLKLLAGLDSLSGELLVLIREKHATLRRGELDAMHKLTEREQRLAQRIQEREGLRRQLTDALVTPLRLPPRAARSLTLSQLADHVAEPQRGALLTAGHKLRETLFAVTQANRVVGAASREVLNHLKWVFASVRPCMDQPLSYCGSGAAVACSDTRILDAVG